MTKQELKAHLEKELVDFTSLTVRVELRLGDYDEICDTQDFHCQLDGSPLLFLMGIKSLNEKGVEIVSAISTGTTFFSLYGKAKGRIVEEQAVTA
ncbi:MAG: hypothetical protein ACF8OB_05025 [Phycisphaeraceae bacterium JB051]